jgi:hypothetical protein
MRGIVKTFTLQALGKLFDTYGCYNEGECKLAMCNVEYVTLEDAEKECKTLWERANDLASKNDTMYRNLERLRGIGKQMVSGPSGIVNAVISKITELTQKLTEANAERQRLDKINADLNGQLSISKSAQDFWFKRAKQAEETLSFAAQVAPPRPIEINLNPFDRPANQQQMYGFEGMAFRYDPKSQTVQVPVDIMRQTVTKAQAYRSGMVDYNEALSRDNNALRESLLAIAKLVGAAEGSKFADVVLVAQDIVADRNVARTELRAAHRAIDSKDEQIEDLRDECNTQRRSADAGGQREHRSTHDSAADEQVRRDTHQRYRSPAQHSRQDREARERLVRSAD